MKIYNTLSGQKEEFQPANPPNVLFYNCGPTVYDTFHIGNARNFVVADTIRRYLEYRGYRVRFIQNLTDVDDKIIARANEEGITPAEVAEKYTRVFYDQCRRLGVRRAEMHPRATESIPQMIALIQTLMKKDHAYAVGGDVYFSVRSFAGYGQLSGKNVDDLREGARVDVDERKKDPLDFALWKAAKPGEPSWDSPWGPGRPGWHIECSAMATSHLAETIDIHSGGADLIFPHHENERAQSEAATGLPFVKYWVHNGFLNINSQKMSKSLGNFFTISQVLEKYDPLTVKFFLLSAHYRHPLDFNEENLQNARAACRRILDALETSAKVASMTGLTVSRLEAPEEEKEKWVAFRRAFEDAMDDDFNTAVAQAVLHEIASALHEAVKKCGDAKSENEMRPALAAIKMHSMLIRELLDILGLEPDLGASAEDASPRIVDELLALLIELRRLAREKKDYQAADLIRNGLANAGIVLEDRPQGTIWKRKEQDA
ncbi:MAG TPA: cysteine--tRNA ligase [Candidatus Sumerlaeota bacterium]|nr:cysteine--tRNA ligase [Candidatus Sumerlaeota bacterium]